MTARKTAPTIEVLVVNPPTEESKRGTWGKQQIPPTWDALRGVIDCTTLELLRGLPNWQGWVDEDGRLKGSAINHRASVLARALGWPGMVGLVGTVVFSGPMDFESNPTGVSSQVLAVWEASIPGDQR